MWEKIGKIVINIIIKYHAIAIVMLVYIIVKVSIHLSLGCIWIFILVIFITKIITVWHIWGIEVLATLCFLIKKQRK
jgi:hypothetical protein